MGIGIELTMRQNQQPGPSNETRPKKRKFMSVINDNSLEEKKILPPPEQLADV